MAIMYVKVSNISRGSGRSAVAAAAYRSGERLQDYEIGKSSDYRRKGGVVMSEIALPINAPERLRDRETLWNEVQKKEKRSDARLAREVLVALPTEMSREEQIACIRDYVADNFTDEGMIADWALHEKEPEKHEQSNPHVHIMLTVRGFTEKGEWDNKSKGVFANAFREVQRNGDVVRVPTYDPNKPCYDPKNKEETERYRIPVYDKEKLDIWIKEHGRPFDLDKDREQLKEVQACRVRAGKGTEYKWEKVTIPTNDWKSCDKIEKWRENWAKQCNRYLCKEQQIDHRSYERQGIDRIPQIHEGYAARQMEKRGIVSERCELNREIKETNKIIDRIKDRIRSIRELAQEKARGLHERIKHVRNTFRRTRDGFSTHTSRTDRGIGDSGDATVGDRNLEENELRVAESKRQINKSDELIAASKREAAGLERLIRENQEREVERNERIRKLRERRKRSSDDARGDAGRDRKEGRDYNRLDAAAIRERLADRDAERRKSEAKRQGRDEERERLATERGRETVEKSFCHYGPSL